MKQLKMWGATLAAALMFVGASAQTVQDVFAKMKEAGDLVNAKNFAEAAPALEAVVNMGLDVGGDEAMTIVNQAKGLLPQVYLAKGGAEIQAKQFDAAMISLTKAEELADLQGNTNVQRNAARTISNLYMQEGITSFNAKDYTKALEAFQKGAEKDPNNIRLVYFTAKSYAEQDNLDQAIDLYNKVIAAGASNNRYAKEAEDAKKDLDTYLLVAASEAARAGKIDELSKYVAAIPDNADAGLIFVQTANNQKKYDMVIAQGPAAYEAQTDAAKKSEVAYLLGVAYQNKDNSAKAVEWLRKVTAGNNVSAARSLISDLSK